MKVVGKMLVIGLLLGLVGCDQSSEQQQNRKSSVADVKQLTEEEVVSRRALERMQALIARDWKKAYEYLSPSRRKALPYGAFEGRMRSSAILRDDASIRSVECSGEVCDVRLDLTYTYVGGIIDALQGQQMTSILEEKWVRSDGNWWYVEE